MPRGVAYWRLACAFAILAPVASAAGAQEAAPPAAVPQESAAIAVIQQEQLYQRTRFGQAMLAKAEAARKALQAENQRLEAALETEERELTARRADMTPEAFRPLAEAFDEKVKGIRQAQDTKARALTRQAEDERGRFLQTAAPVLANLMSDLGAAVLIDKSFVVLSLDSIDITNPAIERIDAVLGDGSDAAPVAPQTTPPTTP